MNNQKGNAVVLILIVLGFFASLFVLAIIGSALNLIMIPWLKFDRQVQMNRDIVTKTYDADNAIYNYEWFKQKLQDIKATEAQTQNAKDALASFRESAGPRDKWTFEDKTEDARLNTVVLGLKNQYESLVADYNARTSMANRNIFQDDLPLFFSLKPF